MRLDSRMKKGRRNSIQVRNDILKVLNKKGEMSIRALEREANSNPKTLRDLIADLKMLELISVQEHKFHPKNNKPYKNCKITEKGKKFLERIK